LIFIGIAGNAVGLDRNTGSEIWWAELKSDLVRCPCQTRIPRRPVGTTCYPDELADTTQKRIVVAIDGPAGAGKSTIAKGLAARLGFTYIDTGAMYRAVALWAVRQGVDPGDMHRTEQLAIAAAIELSPGHIALNGEDVTDAIRTPEVSSGASKIAVIPGVRRAMVAKQREIGERSSVVMEGRDIGTVVFPDAQVKIFLDANPDERVRRRCEEMRAKGETVNAGQLAAQMKERDERDSTRADAPLAQAPDAVYLDSTGQGIEEVIESILRIVRSRVTNGRDYR
jgi:cytidylate kinase